MGKRIKISWADEPAQHDYAAAEDYLCLIAKVEVASDLAKRLRKASITQRAARDIVRATGISLVSIEASDEERIKIVAGEDISPLLLVRYEGTARVVVADGFHRLCTVYTIDPTAMVPFKII